MTRAKLCCLSFIASDHDGDILFDVVGKGKLTKYTDAAGAPKDLFFCRYQHEGYRIDNKL